MNEEPQLSIQDIALAARIIDVATRRGAIRAEEMEEVGGVYKRLESFVQASMPKNEEEQSEE